MKLTPEEKMSAVRALVSTPIVAEWFYAWNHHEIPEGGLLRLDNVDLDH